MSEKLLFGAGRCIITPKIGANLYGYRPDIISNAINDDLTATVFYFEQGSTKALLISTTLCLIQTKLALSIKKAISEKFSIPTEAILLHATHTHSGPNVSGNVGWGDIDREYCDEIFIPKLLEAVKASLASPVPVKLKIRQGKSLVGINRRQILRDNRVGLGQNPWGAFNPQMTLISFVSDEKCLATLIHYGAHGTACGANREISRDWSGVMTDRLEAVGGGITAFFNGPEGDVGPRVSNGRTTGDNTPKYAMELGGFAAQDAIAIFNQSAPSVDAALKVSEKTVPIPLKPRLSLDEAKSKLRAYEGKTVNIDGKKKNHYTDVVASYGNGYEEKSCTHFSQSIVSFGQIAIVSTPYELFSEIGMRIAEYSPFEYTLTLSNTNGSGGYFVTEDAICRGGYEVDMFQNENVQPYVDNADYHLITETVAHLNELKGE